MRKLSTLMILMLVMAMLPTFATAQKGPAVEVVGDDNTAVAIPSGYPAANLPEALLYDNGPLVTHPGQGYMGADASVLQTNLGLSTYGFGNQYSYGYRMADDFTITDPGGWQVDGVVFFAYQTGTYAYPPVSTINGLYFQIWDGSPDDPGSSIVFGDLVTNRLAGTSWATMYRVTDYDLQGATRPPMANVGTAGVVLPPGTYWLDWMTNGSGASGPWAPPISIVGETTTGNALQYTGAWAAAVDTGLGTPQGMPFQVYGEVLGGGEDPDIEVTPASLYAEQCPDTITTQTLQICNVGTADLTWTLTEQPAVLGGKGTLPAGATSQQAPAGYVPQRAVTTGTTGGTVLLLKNTNPWGSVAVENILSANAIPYEVHGSGEFGSLDFGLYGMVYVQCDQDQAFYDAYSANAAKFEQYVVDGGFMAFCAADQGWNGGYLTAPLPGGMTYAFYGENYIWIDDPSHPTMAGVPNPFYGSWAGHGVFSNLPVGAHIIAHGEASAAPVTVEYGLGSGWFIGLAETLEITYDYGWEGAPVLPNTLLWGYAWGGASGVPWLSEDPVEGTVPAGGCVDVTVTFDSTGLAVGDYFANLVIDSNDPDEPQVVVPVQLTVLECGNTLTCGGISYAFSLDPYGRELLKWWVEAVDQAGAIVPLVAVDADLTWPAGGPVSRTRLTHFDGYARFHWGSVAAGTWTIDVTDMTLAGYSFVDGAQCSASVAGK
ncbi:MAG TPA: hypothetical protein PKO09_16775 [Anaerolineae bacterium]|nr:hypothetical protein [Anaerolineae bacterium]